MALIYEYLQKGSMPEDYLEADRLARKAKIYTLVEGVLYKNSGHSHTVYIAERRNTTPYGNSWGHLWSTCLLQNISR